MTKVHFAVTSWKIHSCVKLIYLYTSIFVYTVWNHAVLTLWHLARVCLINYSDPRCILYGSQFCIILKIKQQKTRPTFSIIHERKIPGWERVCDRRRQPRTIKLISIDWRKNGRGSVPRGRACRGTYLAAYGGEGCCRARLTVRS